MIILSWDVGIKNLAFCKIDFQSSSNWKIIDWNIINITEEEEHNCCNCTKKGNFYLGCNDSYYCKVHSKKVIIDVPIDFENTNNNCNHLIKDCFCDKKGYKKVNLNQEYHLCKAHFKQYEKKITNFYSLNKVIKSKTSDFSTEDLVYKLVTILDNKPDLLEVDYVVIENQPSLKNPRMKNISSTVYNYFLIRGLIDKKKIKKVKYMSPSNKIKLTGDKYKNENLELVKLKGDMAKSYKLTKSLAVKYTKDLINNDWLYFFNQHKKKDDLADCLLQGLYFGMNLPQSNTPPENLIYIDI
ncbi:putative Holliday junction resolvase [Chlorella virus XW01]|nr:putative Holliday junction resolvase [Chlorella virus XW01]